jgi:hypothetical protein
VPPDGTSFFAAWKGFFMIKDINRIIKNRKAAAALMAAFTLMFITLCPQPLFAASGAEIVTDSFGSIFEIIKAAVSSLGACILLWDFFEMGTSMQSQEGTMQAMGFKKIGGALLMTLAPQIVGAWLG